MHDLRTTVTSYATSAARSMWAPHEATKIERFCWYACWALIAMILAGLAWAISYDPMIPPAPATQAATASLVVDSNSEALGSASGKVS